MSSMGIQGQGVASVGKARGFALLRGPLPLRGGFEVREKAIYGVGHPFELEGEERRLGETVAWRVR
jgi:hypothetical protein